MDNVRDWVEGPTALGARGGALEEVGVGTEAATSPTMAAAVRAIPRCLLCGPCAVVSVGEGSGRPS